MPLIDLTEHQEDLLGPGELSPPGIDPRESLAGLGAQQHHVVVRGDDHLARPAGMLEHLPV